MSSKITVYDLIPLITRSTTKQLLQRQGMIVQAYRFETRGTEALICHFGDIELNGSRYGLIDFLDLYFSPKRQTILNNVAKCLGFHKEVL